MGRWLHMSDDHPPDYDEIASPPSYLEAIKGQYCRRHTSLRRDYPTIPSHNLKEQRNRKQYSNLLWTTDMMYSGTRTWNSDQQF